jgi:hypothetical protein
MPGLAVVVGAEDECEILRVLTGENVHRSQQMTVGMADEGGRAECATREGVAGVIGMEVVDNCAYRFRTTSETDAALFLSRLYEKYVVGVVLKSRDIELT